MYSLQVDRSAKRIPVLSDIKRDTLLSTYEINRFSQVSSRASDKGKTI